MKITNRAKFPHAGPSKDSWQTWRDREGGLVAATPARNVGSDTTVISCIWLLHPMDLQHTTGQDCDSVKIKANSQRKELSGYSDVPEHEQSLLLRPSAKQLHQNHSYKRHNGAVYLLSWRMWLWVDEPTLRQVHL